MSVAPGPTAGRGDITLQPSYFTSSLFVHPFREDVSNLVRLFSDAYATSPTTQPFALFKTIWSEEGWVWMHLKVFDARSRDTYLKVVMRLFLERMVETEPPLNRVVALFGLYTFFQTQPSTSGPSLHSVKQTSIPLDQYTSLLALPDLLTTPALQPLKLHTVYILSTLLKAQIFYIVPDSTTFPLNPRELPREIFVEDTDDMSASLADGAQESAVPKKKGRPSKREKAKKAKDALVQLDKWLEKTNYTPPGLPNAPQNGSGSEAPAPMTTHVLISHPPTTTRDNYRSQKYTVLDKFASQQDAAGNALLEKANKTMLARMKKLDQLAAAQGLEVGGEGGERTGLERVEKAFAELDKPAAATRTGGILSLLEGSGLDEDGDDRDDDNAMDTGS